MPTSSDFTGPNSSGSISPTAKLKLTSPAFQDGGLIPPKYTCDGDDINPPFAIFGIPEGAKSLVLIMEDPDAPNGPFVHWVRFNIPPSTEVIVEGEDVPGLRGMGSSGTSDFSSPCPPSGVHHYVFRLYALDNLLTTAESAPLADMERDMSGHILDRAELTGLYGRST